MRQLFPVSFRWRAANGDLAYTRLFWAGPLVDEESLEGFGITGLLGDETIHSNSPLELLIDPQARDGVTSYLQACSSARLEALLGPFPEHYLADHYGGPAGERGYGVPDVPYGTAQDLAEVRWYTQFQAEFAPEEFYVDGPPASWSFVVPAPVPECFRPGHPNNADDGDNPLSALIGVFRAYVNGGGDRWTAHQNQFTGGWCSDRGVYLTNVTCQPRRRVAVPGVIDPSIRQADLTRIAL